MRVGEPEGPRVGDLEGSEDVGETDGFLVGEEDGARVGEAEGALVVGEYDGAPEGEDDGTLVVGAVDGLHEGEAEGTSVRGESVGVRVGDLEGWAKVGACDGEMTGREVGEGPVNRTHTQKMATGSRHGYSRRSVWLWCVQLPWSHQMTLAGCGVGDCVQSLYAYGAPGLLTKATQVGARSSPSVLTTGALGSGTSGRSESLPVYSTGETEMQGRGGSLRHASVDSLLYNCIAVANKTAR